MEKKKMQIQEELEELKKIHQEVGQRIARLEKMLNPKANHAPAPARTTKYDPTELEELIAYHLLQLGCPRHIKGYRYLKEAVAMAVENPDLIEAITKALYPGVAKKFSTTSSRVERAIRHAVEVMWDRGDTEVLEEYFGNTTSNAKGKPTNSEFIAMFVDRIPRELR